LPGLTGVVGPNGCGKSNLLDALRWVMGENRPTSMRGDGMDDVIFGGTSLRPARSYAEVNLQIENFDSDILPINTSESTIEIVRRINFESGSTYRVEGKEILAREVRLLFADYSSGYNSPSLVRQGQISNLINENPKSRKRILEEAAGISGLYHRRHESELKLNASENNLERINDILSKLEEQLKALKKQAKQAEDYRLLGEKIRKQESLLLFVRWENKNSEFNNSKHELDNILKKRTDHEKILRNLIEVKEQKENLLPKIREQQAADQIATNQLLSKKTNIDEKHKNALSRVHELNQRISELENDYIRENELILDAESVLKKSANEKKSILNNQSDLTNKIKSTKEDLDLSIIDFNKIEKEYEVEANNFAASLAKKNNLETNFEVNNKSLKQVEEKITKVKDDKSKVNLRKEEIDNELFNIRNELELSEKAIDKKSSMLDKTEDEVQTLRADLLNFEEKLSEERSKLLAIKSEIKTLEEFLSEQEIFEDAIINQIEISKDFEIVFSVILNDDLNYPPQSSDRKSGWHYTENEQQSYSFPEGVKVLADLVKHPLELNKRLKNVGIVNSKDGYLLHSKLKNGQSLVSMDGDFWRWDGFSTTSADVNTSNTQKVKNLNRLQNLKVLQKEIEKKVSIQSDHKTNQELVFKQKIEERDNLKKEYISKEKRLNELKTNLSKLEAEFEINSAQIESLDNNYLNLNEDYNKLIKNIEEIKNLDNQEIDYQEEEKNINLKKKTLEDFRNKNLDRRLVLEDLTSQFNFYKNRLVQLDKELEDWSIRKKRSVDRQDNILSRKNELELFLETAQLEPEKIENDILNLNKKITEAEKKCSISTDALVNAEKKLRDALFKEKEAFKIAEDLKEKYVRGEVSIETTKDNLNELASLLEAETGHSPKNFQDKYIDQLTNKLSIDIIEKNLDQLTRKRNFIGPVNLRAEEDEKEINAEYSELLNQKEDLEVAVKKLRNAISNLNKEGREKLLKAFDDVNKNFKTLFNNLFGGGQSNLLLVESDDPLEAGLEIMCQPPGKKLSNLAFLSGGVQTLAAISLIFAVFMVKPSPICVLDEVDAPLDDANIVRFCNLLDNMNSRTDTRFIIITHNPITMSKMNRLYGVTMAEKGVSQLVSVDLDKAEKLVVA
ncbi:MAG: AAA family ATPase, partial [Pseudomonadota bacterium]|nr:AAA family ATPase [Pseudomonadota bacterium]